MMRKFSWLILALGIASSPASAQEDYDPQVPRDLELHEWLAIFPGREDLRVCVGRRNGEWTITQDASASAPARARVQVQTRATGRTETQLGTCLEQRIRQQLARAALRLSVRNRTVHDEHTFRVLDSRAIESAYLERRRPDWSAEQERLAVAQCVAPVSADRFPLRVPIFLNGQGAPFIDWPQPPPTWWVAEKSLSNCLPYYLGGVPHIHELPFEHRFVVEVGRDGSVIIASP